MVEEKRVTRFDVLSDVTTITDYDPSKEPSYNSLEFVARHDGNGFRITYGVARDVVENWFVLAKIDDVSIAHSVDKQAQEFAEDNDLHRILEQFIWDARTGGWAIIVDWVMFSAKDKSFQPPYRFEVFTRGNTQIVYDERTFSPKEYKITKKVGKFTKDIVVPAEFVYHASPRGDRWEGDSALLPCMFDIVINRNQRWSVGQTLYRLGTGFPVLSYDDMESVPGEAEVSKVETQFKSIQKIYGMILDPGVNLEFKGASGAVINPDPYMKASYEGISAGSFIPKSQLTGSAQGSKLSAETDQNDYWKLVKGEQKAFTNIIDDIFERSAGIAREGWKIEFNHPEPSESEKLNKELIQTQINTNELAYKTKDEVREKLGLAPLPEEEVEPEPVVVEEPIEDPEDIEVVEEADGSKWKFWRSRKK